MHNLNISFDQHIYPGSKYEKCETENETFQTDQNGAQCKEFKWHV